MIRRPSFPRLPSVNGQSRHRSDSRAMFTIRGTRFMRSVQRIGHTCCHGIAHTQRDSEDKKKKHAEHEGPTSYRGSPRYRHWAFVAPSRSAINSNAFRGANWGSFPVPRRFRYITGNGGGAFLPPSDASRSERCPPHIVAKVRARKHHFVCEIGSPAALRTIDTI